MGFIKRIKLQNYKRFKFFAVEFGEGHNIFVGDNESGKSTIIESINFVLSGTRKKIDTLALESMFNFEVIKNFLGSDRKYENLPTLFIELYLNEQNDHELNGKCNSENIECDGLKLECLPNDDLSKQIKEILEQEEPIFPFEYYSINIYTFAGIPYTGYKKCIKHILLDHSQIGNEYALREYVRDMYYNYIEGAEKQKHFNKYREHKNIYVRETLSNLNSRIENYTFSIKNNSKSNLETDLTLCEGDIDIENKGRGKQCFIKTEFALSKKGNNIDVILIEEPENHLSHVNMNKLINKISEAKDKQLFIATHSNMICARLDLRKSILLNSSSESPALMQSLPEPTAKFFIKAPNNNALDFILSKKVILVEGDAEFILMEKFFQLLTNSELALSDLHIMSVGGISFKRYLEIAKILDIKTAVIRDNDKDYEKKCVENFKEYTCNYIKIFSDSNNNRNTFEVCLYEDNKDICDALFGVARKTLTVLEYMLENKAEAALELLEKKGDELNIPAYIKEAILWIKE
ncbi:ATP-dependent endonuclease [bacterium]|nr:ATP-dependent endonuclease [bacterium]